MPDGIAQCVRHRKSSPPWEGDMTDVDSATTGLGFNTSRLALLLQMTPEDRLELYCIQIDRRITKPVMNVPKSEFTIDSSCQYIRYERVHRRDYGVADRCRYRGTQHDCRRGNTGQSDCTVLICQTSIRRETRWYAQIANLSTVRHDPRHTDSAFSSRKHLHQGRRLLMIDQEEFHRDEGEYEDVVYR